MERNFAKNFLTLSVTIIGLTINFNSFSLQTDKTKILYIKSDSVNLDSDKGICYFIGHAKADEGSTHITGKTIIARINKQNKLKQVTSIGKPATYRSLEKQGDPEFHADAQVIDYYPQQKLAKLRGRAHASQGDDKFYGPNIQYDINRELVTSKSSKQSRSTFILTPR